MLKMSLQSAFEAARLAVEADARGDVAAAHEKYSLAARLLEEAANSGAAGKEEALVRQKVGAGGGVYGRHFGLAERRWLRLCMRRGALEQRSQFRGPTAPLVGGPAS